MPIAYSLYGYSAIEFLSKTTAAILGMSKPTSTHCGGDQITNFHTFTKVERMNSILGIGE